MNQANKEKAKVALNCAKEKAKAALSEIKTNFKADEGTEGVKKYKSMFANLWKSGTTGKATLVAASIVVLLLFKSIFFGGSSDGGFDSSKSADVDTLVMKGLYMRQSGDEAMKACKKIASSLKDLVAIDFRKGIEREKDKATKAADKKRWEDLLKLAETDVDLLLNWNSIYGYEYNPSLKECKGKQHSVTVPGPLYTFGAGLASFAAAYGYQVEWMLPGKPKNAVKKEPKLLERKFEIPSNTSADVLHYWRNEVANADKVLNELSEKGLKCSESEDGRVFFRLKLQNKDGNSVEKSNLVTDFLLAEEYLFGNAKTKEEKIAQAEHEVDRFLDWVEVDAMDRINYVGSQIKTTKQKDKDVANQNRQQEMAKHQTEQEIKKVQAEARKQCDELKRECERIGKEYSAKEQKARSAFGRDPRKYAKVHGELQNEKFLKQEAINARQKKIEREAAMRVKELSSSGHDKKGDDAKKRMPQYKLPDSRFLNVMADLSRRCKLVIEWAVFVEPVDELVETKKTFVISEKTKEGAFKFIDQLNINLGESSESIVGSDHSRKRILFEKDLEDVRSPVWFRLVLKNANGVEVAKGDVVKNWLAARGHYPPSDKVIIAKKNLIEIAIEEDGKREDELKGVCFVWIDGEDKVKEVYFNEKGMARIFNAGDLSSDEFAEALVKNYQGDIPSLTTDVRTEAATDDLLASMKTRTWIYKDPRGYQVKLLERDFYDVVGQKVKLREDLALALALKADKTRDKFFTVFAIKPESARKFD